MSSFKYDDLESTFQKHLEDPEVLNCGQFNLLKIFQHAIGSYKNQRIPAVRSDFMNPIFIQKMIGILRIYKRRKEFQKGANIASTIQKKKYLVYSGGNCLKDENGKLTSANTRNILETLGRENCLYVYKEYKGNAEATGQDFNFSDLSFYGENSRPTTVLIKFMETVRKWRKELKGTDAISEDVFVHLDPQLQIFLNNLRCWHMILLKCKPEKIFFTMHYHHEGLIAAAKMLNIPIYELQHGLISENDFYYVYSDHFKSVIANGLFADKILLFGKYWASILDKGCEYPPEKRFLIGSYQFRPKILESSKVEFKTRMKLQDKKVILIATQTNIAEFYSDYINQLAPVLLRDQPDHLILIKPHPNQKKMKLLETCLSHDNVRICEKTDDLMLALSIAHIQISVYSTTFYDGLGTGVVNLSLIENEKYQTFSKLMVSEGIAFPLKHAEDPVKVAEAAKESKSLDRADVYAPFNPEFRNI